MPRRRRQLSKEKNNHPTSNKKRKEMADKGAANGETTTEIKKSDKIDETENTSQNTKSSNKHEHEKSKIAILGEVIDLMKSESDQNEYSTILQNLLEVSKSEEAKKGKQLQIINFLLENLKGCSEEDLSSFSEKNFDFMLPKELLKIVTKKDDVIEEKGVLGSGGFGVVRKCIFSPAGGSKTVVAIKIANSGKENYLENEAKIMSQLNHTNILRIVAFQKKPAKLIMEFMDCGNLTEFLLERVVTLDRLYIMMLNVLSGMEYMSEKKFIHRDLNTRNIFVNSQFLCKIGDFGFSCYVSDINGVYSEKEDILVGPHIPPESRLTQIFTTKSDVWAMGLLISDMFFLKDMDDDFDYTRYKEQQAIVLTFMGILHPMEPPQCPKSLFNYITNNIMDTNPNSRPSFTEIIHIINAHYSLSNN